MSEIKNGIVSLEDLFAANVFRIPQYQRAYAWQRQPQLQAFVDDLVQQAHTQARSTHKRYFLGTLLLHADASGVDSPVDVVDGQQRLTTTVIFMATAVRLAEQGRIELDDAASLKNAFLRDATTERQKFHTIREDSLYFRHRILDHSPNAPAAESPSARLMRDASDFFDAAIPAGQWPALVATLRAANVMVYAVDNAEDATQIFELQNDRGRPLTTLESLKSFLMHSIYIHSPKRADEHLADVQDQFSKIFRAVENLQSIDGAPDEDQVLSNHCTAFEEWTEKEYANPKQLVKRRIKQLAMGREVVDWIAAFAASLVWSFGAVEEILDRRDELPEFTHLFVMGRMASFWPLLLTAWKHDESVDKADFRKVCALLEVFAFRGYAIAGIRSNGSQSTFFLLSREFRGAFPALLDELVAMCDLHDVPARFERALDNPRLYEEDGADARYLLWRYENHLRDKVGQKQSKESWRSFLDRTMNGTMLTIEHVSARTNSVTERRVEWDGTGAQPFADVALHRLGNLVLDSASMNAAKGARDFKDKLAWFQGRSSYLSQAELLDFVDDRANPVWNANAIRRRHDHLMRFCRDFWDPSRYRTMAR